ncbi:hypothetical protein G6F22_021260 [Rhizopus arrhizus]|nr:hypothetical protein G6F22_021260 [Rhizopus arrhizus]
MREDGVFLKLEHRFAALLAGGLAGGIQVDGQQAAVAADGGEAARTRGQRDDAPASCRRRDLVGELAGLQVHHRDRSRRRGVLHEQEFAVGALAQASITSVRLPRLSRS